MPRSRKVDSPERLEQYIAEYIDLCRDSNDIPSDYGLADYIGCSVRSIERWRKGEGNYRKYSEAFVELKKFAESVLIREVRTAKNPAGAIFLLKQEKFGGYTDKQEIETAGSLTIKVDGVGADSFK